MTESTELAPRPPRKRLCYVPAPQLFNLNMACVALEQAFSEGGLGCYLVGSSLERRDYRDVDVRCILRDEYFEKLFGKCGGRTDLHPLWAVMCSSISLWLSKQSGLPVDFQIQRLSGPENTEEHGPRHPLGIFIQPNPPDYSGTAAADGVEP
jgi:hypothetical protein